jgi:quinol-cytochrome oxidoreductase complex cytochrome b subunit/mono/diheme cytochrome c family protein
MVNYKKKKRFLKSASLLLIILGGFFLLAIPALASSTQLDGTQTATALASTTPTLFLVTLTPTPPIAPSPTFDLTRLDRPAVSDTPTQQEQGLLVFWGICMACHGDNGQGLTDEWRESFGEDRNCWTSKCHASNHPPQGFEFPHIVPSLTGDGRLARFVNARQLYEYNLERMPWWDPGSLTEEKAWAVTAYIMEMNGRLPAGTVLTKNNADLLSVQFALVESPTRNRGWLVLLAASLFTAATGLILYPIAQNTGKRPSFFLHIHPPTIPALQARIGYTLGAGGLAVFLSLILLITGLLETFYYIPSVERASASIQEITFLVPFGNLVRNLHYWSAQALVIVAGIHLFRIILTGAHTKRQRFNYLLGLALFVIVLLLDFTGYVLRWDEGIRWALIAGTNLLGSMPSIGSTLVRFISGSIEPGPAMLIRFYAWHIFGLSILGVIMIVWHIFRVRRDGGISVPPPAYRQDTNRITRIELFRREIIAMLFAGGILVLIATFIQAPIAQPMNVLLVSLTESRAPWFFLWVQELLKLGEPFIWGILVPVVFLILLAIIPYIFPKLSDAEAGIWFPRSGRPAQIFAGIILAIVITLSILALIPINTP